MLVKGVTGSWYMRFPVSRCQKSTQQIWLPGNIYTPKQSTLEVLSDMARLHISSFIVNETCHLAASVGVTILGPWHVKSASIWRSSTWIVIQVMHYTDVIMGTIASQITSFTIVYSTVYSDADQRKYQNSASLAFVWGIHRRPVSSPHKWPVTRKIFPFDDVIMDRHGGMPPLSSTQIFTQKTTQIWMKTWLRDNTNIKKTKEICWNVHDVDTKLFENKSSLEKVQLRPLDINRYTLSIFAIKPAMDQNRPAQYALTRI